MSDFAFRIVGVDPEHVQRNLAMNRNRLNAIDDADASAFEHGRNASSLHCDAARRLQSAWSKSTHGSFTEAVHQPHRLWPRDLVRGWSSARRAPDPTAYW